MGLMTRGERLTGYAASREPAHEDLRRVRASVPVAEEVEGRVGRGALLLGPLPEHAQEGVVAQKLTRRCCVVWSFREDEPERTSHGFWVRHLRASRGV